MLARVAVSQVTYGIDKPYDYLIPQGLLESVCPGVRVLVPFGRGNRRHEAMVLSLEDGPPPRGCKELLQVLDREPILDGQGLRLAAWLRTRCFCTLFEALHAMLPAGLWHKLEPVWQLVRPESGENLSPEGEALIAYLSDRPDGASERELSHLLGKECAGTLRALEAQGVLRCRVDARQGVTDRTLCVARLAVSREEARAWAARRRTGAMQRAVAELLLSRGRCSVKEICYFTGASRQTVQSLARAGLVSFELENAYHYDYGQDVSGPPPEIALNAEQQRACDGLSGLLAEGHARCALLYGVTGSGKTLVYLKLLHQVVEQGGQAVVLVPEISLTPQLAALFSRHFGRRVALFHSGLTQAQRYDEWRRIRRGEVDVAVGTRSAVFAPFSRLRLMVIDEEQEHTYRSENSPSYHARDVAKFRCVQSGALLVLGSATPSVETMYCAKNGTYELFTLPSRYNAQKLPEVLLADSREELRSGNGRILSRILQEELAKNINSGEQSILFINRRGASRFLLCADCGEVPGCPNCSVSLTYHAANGRLMCHYCGHSQPVPERCPACGGELRHVGFGTQRVEQELGELFPQAEVLRMDADTTSARSAHERILERFRTKRVPILLGTQMVTKGLDFENVTLVGILNADLSLYADDFRAAERTFSLITQVVGRAGRGERRGRAVLQTYSPHHPVLNLAARQDYDGFYENEIGLRRATGAPPFSDYLVFTVFGGEELRVLKACTGLAACFRRAQGEREEYGSIRLLGPAPAGVAKVNNLYRYRVTLCGRFDRAMRELVGRLLITFRQDSRNRETNISVDLNPD